MNKVFLIGRLTKDAEIKVIPSTQQSVAKFNLAIDKGKKDGKDLGADFIPCVAFGKTAEVVEKYTKKGSQIAVDGSITTGSYEKDGKKVYTFDVLVSRIELLGTKEAPKEEPKEAPAEDPFSQMGIDFDDLPF